MNIYSVIYLSVGIAVANRILSLFGLEDNYILVFAVAFVLSRFQSITNILILITIFVGVVSINLADTTLFHYNLDRDILLAIVCTLIIAPSIYKRIVA